MLAFVLFFSAVYAIYSWTNLKRGLTVLLAFLPAYLIQFEFLGIPSNFLEVMIVVFTAVFGGHLILNEHTRKNIKNVFAKNKIFHACAFLFLVSACISTLYSVDLFRALGVLKAYFIEPVIVLYLILSIFTSKKDIQKLLALSSWPVFFVSVAGIFQFFGIGLPIPEGYEFQERRATSIFPYPAALAWYILPYLVIYFLFFLNVAHPKYKKAFYKRHNRYNRFYVSHWIIVLTVIVALFLSKAEGAIGAFVIVVYGYFLFTKKYRLIAILSGLAGASSLFLFEGLREYVWQVISFQNVSGEVRLALWEGTINLLKQRPLIGAGLASFPEIYDQFRLARHVELLLYPHNILLNFWVELGILGLLSFIGMMTVWLRKAIRNILELQSSVGKSFGVAIFGAMIAILIYGLVDVPYFKNDLAVQFMFIVGALFTISKGSK